MKIDIESPMRRAAADGLREFTPVFQGQPLEAENGSPDVSLRNLRIIAKSGLKVCSMTVVEHGFVLILFTTGETYLATGFGVGELDRRAKLFAQFASEHYSGGRRDWETHLGCILSKDQPGVIHPDLTPVRGPKIFRADSEK